MILNQAPGYLKNACITGKMNEMIDIAPEAEKLNTEKGLLSFISDNRNSFAARSTLSVSQSARIAFDLIKYQRYQRVSKGKLIMSQLTAHNKCMVKAATKYRISCSWMMIVQKPLVKLINPSARATEQSCQWM